MLSINHISINRHAKYTCTEGYLYQASEFEVLKPLSPLEIGHGIVLVLFLLDVVALFSSLETLSKCHVFSPEIRSLLLSKSGFYTKTLGLG